MFMGQKDPSGSSVKYQLMEGIREEIIMWS